MAAAGTLTAGIDAGTSGVKVALMEYRGKFGAESRLLFSASERIRRRAPKSVVRALYERALVGAQLQEEDVAYVASTGDGELVPFRRGHFYGMTAHARGAKYLVPDTRSVVDIGALHARAMKCDHRSKVLAYQMTGQCASGSGQFLENIAKYLGVSLDEVGPLSLQGDDPELVSGICAVLAETDVINMVSRGISTANILKGIHLSIAKRIARLVKGVQAEPLLTVTGGMARNEGLMETLKETFAEGNMELELAVHEHSTEAGAIGAALWAGFRHQLLAA